jgi:hypothetical protein
MKVGEEMKMCGSETKRRDECEAGAALVWFGCCRLLMSRLFSSVDC